MALDILTACDGHFSKIQGLLESIAAQTVQPERVIILIYKNIAKEEQELFAYYIQRMIGEEFFSKVSILSHLNSDHISGKGHGYDRKFLLSHAQSNYIFMVDNDNQFKDDFLEQMESWYRRIEKELHRDLILSPTIIYQKNGEIQSQGINGFSYWFPKFTFNIMSGEHRQEVKMVGANSLFGATDLFRTIDFDKKFPGTYEDIDFSYRCYLAGYPIIVLNSVDIFHKETKTGKLEELFLGNPTIAYRRSRNRVLFVKKNATAWQKVQYFGLGLWLQTLWFWWIIAWYGGNQRLQIWSAVWQGTMAGIRKKLY